MLFLTEEELSDFDVLVDAFATSPDKAYLHVDLAAKLVHLFREKHSLVLHIRAGSLFNEAGNVISELKSTRKRVRFLLGMSFKKDQLNQRF